MAPSARRLSVFDPGQFDLTHGIGADAAGRVFVADRSNSRACRGSTVTDASSPSGVVPTSGRPYAIALDSHGKAYVADGGDQPTDPPDRSAVAVLDSGGKVLTRFGRFGNYDGQFRRAHDIAVGPDGSVYVADTGGQRIQKFIQK